MNLLTIVSAFLFNACITIAEEIDARELRCLVCRKTVDELQSKLNNIDSSKTIEVGQYRLDAKGNALHKKVPLAKSEIHISDTLDEICQIFDDYARAKYKTSGNLVLVDLKNPFNKKSPGMDKVDFIQDGDLNKSLKFLCEDIVNEFEDTFTTVFKNDLPNVHDSICTEVAQYCEEGADYDIENTDQDIDTKTSEQFDKTEL